MIHKTLARLGPNPTLCAKTGGRTGLAVGPPCVEPLPTGLIGVPTAWQGTRQEALNKALGGARAQARTGLAELL